MSDAQFKRQFTEQNVEVFARTLVHYCCKQYSGSDDKAKPYIWDLVHASYADDWAARKAVQQQLEEGKKSERERKKGSFVFFIVIFLVVLDLSGEF